MAEAIQRTLDVKRIYLKDLSFEVPHAPAMFLETQQQQGNINVQIDTSALVLPDGLYEVTVFATITTTFAEKVAFLVEAKQSGIFEIRGFQDSEMAILIEVNCANILYPYLQAALGDAIARAGFPPVHLPIGYFDMRFQAKVEEAQKAAAAGQGPAGAQLPH
jgi:preprotein translocase subunit SecB